MSKIKENRESLDEIVFENRNKVYGAYQIRKQYKKELNRSLFIVLFLFTCSIGIMLLMSFKEAGPVIIIPSDTTFVFTKYDLPDFKIPDPPSSEKNDEAKIENDTRFKIVTDVTNEKEEVELPSNDNIHISNKVTTEIKENFEIKKEKNEVIPEDNTVYEDYMIKEPPAFPGGNEALYKFIKDNTVYNEIAKGEGITGKVYLSFVVDKEGNVTDVKIIRGLDPYLDIEALKVIKKMPKWEPGKDNGDPVNVLVRIPIKFVLE